MESQAFPYINVSINVFLIFFLFCSTLDGTVVNVSEVIQELKHTFCGPVSIETSQLNTQSEKSFMSIALTELRNKELPDEKKKFIAQLLIESEVQILSYLSMEL